LIPPREINQQIGHNFSYAAPSNIGQEVIFDCAFHTSTAQEYSNSLICTDNVYELKYWIDNYQTNLAATQSSITGLSVGLDAPIHWYSSCVYYKLWNQSNFPIKVNLYFFNH